MTRISQRFTATVVEPSGFPPPREESTVTSKGKLSPSSCLRPFRDSGCAPSLRITRAASGLGAVITVCCAAPRAASRGSPLPKDCATTGSRLLPKIGTTTSGLEHPAGSVFGTALISRTTTSRTDSPTDGYVQSSRHDMETWWVARYVGLI